MAATPPRAVLDASALLAWLLDERGASTVDRLLPVSAVVSVNLAEAYERIGRTDPDELASVTEDLLSLGMTLLPFEPEDAELVPMVRAAGRRKDNASRTGLSLGDCCCLAAAIRRQLPVVTDDGLWSALDLGVPVHLFR